MATGQLSFEVTAAHKAEAVEGVSIQISKLTGDPYATQTLITDADGSTEVIDLPAPDPALQRDVTYEGAPYDVYSVVATKDGYLPTYIDNIQVYGNAESWQEIAMVPIDQDQYQGPNRMFPIPAHQLTLPEPCYEFEQPVGRVLSTPIIPTTITVHLGTPTNSAAENYTLPFKDYIKNVASSEIYPDWPDAALRANIYCQISLTLNRVYTEWYPSRGYSFNITNSTQYDQAFVKNRNIYASISRIVDEIFNVYIRRNNFVEPYFAEYCDGRYVTNCPGLKQWGTVTLANQGYTPLRILQYYYGNSVYLYENNNIQSIELSYPGTPLRVGSTGNSVIAIQNQLNRIRKNYPAIPLINPVDGVFGTSTEAAVRAFQKIFKLTQDGIVGKSTWYQISYIYVAVKKLAELSSEGEEDSGGGGGGGTPVLRQGDTGDDVRNLQHRLRTVAMFFESIPDLTADGIFGPGTTTSVKAFQQYFGLTADGIVGPATWARLNSLYAQLNEAVPPSTCFCARFPGILRQGSSGNGVSNLQYYLTLIRQVNTTIPALSVDGNFGSGTRAAVIQFQKIAGVSADGIVGAATWAELCDFLCSLPTKGSCPTYPGGTYRQGNTGNPVRQIQFMLNVIAALYPQVGSQTVDGIFGAGTTRAVRTVQTLAGVTADGIVGATTWARMCAFFNQSPFPNRV